ncbi:zinc finger protein 609 [Latimeria chalumnae]|uniref:zinc finger protein 609 n=1 Tax=Latimeria chalumnae TaxID=7897 RepID=UPI0006D8F41F|nr:PREDICTED: zinc finger protein 609 [Latimeria chalumnae]XP_014346680.1 PREDICTED: zinc finger protein 609 [Latimeria chalumnae]|eukprot:XP_014346679.1 PREDICTED: zinc finger protein 609 [Latimeria chalumnae]
MSLNSGNSGGKGVDSNPVDTYDSGDEWDIGVGNLIIDLDADLEKDQQKLEMSGSKEAGLSAPNAVATLPDNIKFVTPLQTPQGKESKSKSKRSKSGKDPGKPVTSTSLYGSTDGTSGRKDVQGRSGDGTNSGSAVPTVASKSTEKGAKATRSIPASKKESGTPKTKKDKADSGGIPSEKEGSILQPLALGSRNVQLEAGQGVDSSATEQLGNVAVDAGVVLTPLGIKLEPEELEGECRQMKKIKTEKMDSPVSTPAPPPLHLLAPVGTSDISSPCEQIMVRTRSVGVNTSDIALETEPDCLGPCEPGTSVNLEGIVWQETEDGMLVVNVTWRNKTYVGTLLDCTRHDWAPPRFCESPTSDLEMRNGRGRGKRMRPNSNTPLTEASTTSDNKATSSKTRAGTGAGAGASSKGRRGSQNSSERRTPPSSIAEDVKASPSSVNKRKNKPTSDLDLNSSSEDSKGNKRIRTNSHSTPAPLSVVKVEPSSLERNCSSPTLIDCPHPNCNKKYKHINGLKYHQAHAHTDDEIKHEADVDSEYGDDSSLNPDIGSCNGASVSQKGSVSPARSTTPKARITEVHSPTSSVKFNIQNSSKKKALTEADKEAGGYSNDGSDDAPSAADENSNDCVDLLESSLLEKDKTKKAGGTKPEKLMQKNVKSARPIAPAIPPQQIYTFQTATFTATSPGSSSGLTTTVVQAVPKSPQLKPIQPKPTVMGEPSTVNPALTPCKEKKKKDKKKKDLKEGDGCMPQGKGGKPEEGKSPFIESSSDSSSKDGLLNGSSESHQSRLASIKAEADKIYSFSDNAPSPSIGVASRLENSSTVGQPVNPLHVVTQNGADNASVKTSSPAYSDISDAGEDGEGKADSMKSKDPEQMAKDGAKKALFPPQSQNKDSPYYQNFETYYMQLSPSAGNPSSQPTSQPVEGQPMKIKKEEDQEVVEAKVKCDNVDDKKVDLGNLGPQSSVIQQRSNMYMQSLYYNQYAYVPPYSYNDQGYHPHVMNPNPAYRQQYEEQQKQRQASEQPQRGVEKKTEPVMKERESALKEEWKQKASVLPNLTKAPSLTDLAKSGPGKPKDSAPEIVKSVIIPKVEDSLKLQSQQAEGLKGKLTETSHLGKELSDSKPGLDFGRQPGIDPALWYRQEPEAKMWPYVYPTKYSEAQKTEEERWKEERDRKAKEERSRNKEASSKEEGKESSVSDPRPASTEEPRFIVKDSRSATHIPISSPLTHHQPFVSYMHGYPYGQAYDPNHPGYRGIPPVMMQNYPGPYLSPGYSFSPFGSKMSGNEDGDKARASPNVSGKISSECKALDMLHQQYKTKSPTISSTFLLQTSERISQDRGGGERDRGGERLRASPSQRLLPSHHHLGYSLLPGQYDLSYAAGLSSPAIIASHQASAPSLYPPARR